ncbi:MAG TPA: hypothetical protein VHE61_00800 [Opitutaceae bacterium]|nr:hypothetical protein [Opitutaceae bacterium]
MPRISLSLGLLTLILLSAGCMTPAINDEARVGPFFHPKNVVSDLTLGGVRRVVLLPVWGGQGVPEESAASLDPVFRQALQDQNRFEIVAPSRQEFLSRFGAEALSSTAALPHDFMSTLKRVYGADAVMFVDITVYRPYPPLALGIRGKLATVNAPHLIWAFDNVYSADNPEVAAGARHYFLHSGNQDVPGDLTPAILQSPSRFATYASHSAFATLPPVVLPALTHASDARN